MRKLNHPIRLLVACVLFMATQFFSPVQLPAQEEFSRAAIQESVEKIAELIDENYFDIELASQIQKELTSRLNDGGYDDIRTPRELSDRITAQLDQMTRDKHLVVMPRRQEPADPVDTTPVDKEQAEKERAARRALSGKRSNFGIQKFEILPGNIAYLSFTSFYRENEIAEILAAEMKMAANADAVILDMRQNMGGSTGAVSLLSSYFFEGPERKLFDVVPRTGQAKTYSTNATVNNRNETRPVYVLVQSSTFSAGEGLAFILQDQERATVIGEKTAGAANPGRPYFVNSWLEINIPNGYIEAANSKKNWEGTGVTPDIEASANDALDVAQRVALQTLIQQTSDTNYRDELQSLLDKLDRR